MKKYLLTVEFRYHDKPKGEWDSEYQSKKLTIGIYDTISEAMVEGNTAIGFLSKHFQVRPDDKFQENFLMGKYPKTLVTNCCYSTDRIQYFANIDTLHFDNIQQMVTEAFTAYERYREYKLSLKED
jgi:hypothetical protein